MKSSLIRSFLLFSVFCLLLPRPAFGQDGTVKWKFGTNTAIHTAPALGADGTIYFGAFGGVFYAVQPDGTEKWRFQTAPGLDQPPVIAPDGTIYVGDQSGKVYALNPDGSLKWTFDPGVAGSSLTGEMALAADGTLYAGISRPSLTRVYAINPDGTQFWEFDPEITTRGIVVGPNGMIVLRGRIGLTALNPDGSLKWSINIAGSEAPPIFGEDGTIFLGGVSADESFFALNPSDGSIIWQQDLGVIRESASTGENGDIYVPTSEGTTIGAVVAVDPTDGSQKWRFEVGARVETSPLVGSDGTIYFGTDADRFFALEPDGTQLWVVDTGADVRSSPTIAQDGTVYFGSHDENLYAVETSSFGLAASSWPKKQRDVRNTGQFGSNVARKRWFAPHVYWFDDENNAVVTIVHVGGVAGNPAGRTVSFRIDVLDRDGSTSFSVEDMVAPGETKDIVLSAPGLTTYQGSAIVDVSTEDRNFIAPFLTWGINVSQQFAPLQIGAFFSDSTEAAQVHYFPAEASTTNGLGIAVMNIGQNDIECLLEFVNSDGTMENDVNLELDPRGSIVGFFTDSVSDGFSGSAALSCDAPVVAVSVNQDFSNGGFPTDRLTIKRQN